MKTKLLFKAVCMLLMLFGFQFSFASDGGSVMGRVTDPNTKAPAGGVTVVLECLGNQTAFTTNDSGYYYASNLPTGVYTITAAFMGRHASVTEVKIGSDAQLTVNIELSMGETLTGVVINTKRRYNPPLIDPYNISTGHLDPSDIKKLAITTTVELTQGQPGVTDINGVYYVKGAREGSLVYYVDGGRVMAAANNIPLCGLGSYDIYTGFIPPKYGDTEGGVVVLETRNYFTATH